MEIHPIAYMTSDFPAKFGIPYQSGVVPELVSTIRFVPPYNTVDAIRGIEEFSHLWLIWAFSESGGEWSPTVRPPRLGGNTKVGVFATRSPYRPNGLALSSVELLDVTITPSGEPIMTVGGADLMDQTPIIDIKPYVAGDIHPDAKLGFTARAAKQSLGVEFPYELLEKIPENRREALLGVLSNDPRPAYQHDPTRVYGMSFAGFNIRFTCDDKMLRVVDLTADLR